MNKYTVLYSVFGKIYSAEIMAESKKAVAEYLKNNLDILEIRENAKNS